MYLQLSMNKRGNKKKSASFIVKRIKNKLNSAIFVIENKMSKKDFTRERKMPFVSLVIFMLNIVKQTLQKELTQFFSLISKDKNITKSAFCQSRLKLKHTAFIELDNILLEEFYTDNIIDTWKGFRLLAVDGVKLQLPNSPSILQEFGGSNNGSSMVVPTAQASTCYDILNEMIISSEISHCDTGEYPLALLHLDRTKKDDLLIYDRYYHGTWFMFYHFCCKRDFVIRMAKNSISQVREFFSSDEESKIIEITNLHQDSKNQLKELSIEFKPFKIRLVKVILDNGEIEVLATSLLDEEKYSRSIFKGLYKKRWGIETNYDHLKNNLQIENFTGLTPLSIKQDFFANMFITNLQTIIARDVQEEINEETKERKHRYKINRNLSLGFMKDKIVEILMKNDDKHMEELKRLFKIEPVPIRNGRKFPRIDHGPRKKYHMNKKKSV